MIPLQIPFFRFVSSALSFALHDKIRDVVVHIFGMSCKPDLSWCAHPKWSYCAGFVLYVKWEHHATRQKPNRCSPGSLSMVGWCRWDICEILSIHPTLGRGRKELPWSWGTKDPGNERFSSSRYSYYLSFLFNSF